MRNERRLHAVSHHTPRHLHHVVAGDAAPSYLDPVDPHTELRIAADLQTAEEITHSDRAVETCTPFAEAS